MEKQERPIPFGLLFEEAAPQPQGPIIPTYDEDTDLSYVKDSRGRRVPYVELSGAIGTHTGTKIRSEITDTDPEDDNARFFGSLGTVTVTLVEAETTDTDPEDDHGYHYSSRSLVGTDTITMVEKEPTDQD